jgi:hypothetical protein
MAISMVDYFGSYKGGPFLVRFERSGKCWEAKVQMGGFETTYKVRSDSRPSMGVAWRLVRREYKSQPAAASVQ